MYTLLLFTSYLVAASSMQLGVFPPAPIGVRNTRIAGTVSASEPTLGIRNVGVQVYSASKTYTDIVYGYRSVNHVYFYVDTETEITENIVVEVSAPGFKPLIHYIFASEVRLMKTLNFELEVADNRHLITQPQPLTSSIDWALPDNFVRVVFPAGMSIIKANGGGKPEGYIVAAVRIMKQVNRGDEFSGLYKELEPRESLTSEIVIDVTLRDAANNPLEPAYSGQKIKLHIPTSLTKASDVVVKEAASTGKWNALTGLTTSLSGGYFIVDVEANAVNQWRLYKI